MDDPAGVVNVLLADQLRCAAMDPADRPPGGRSEHRPRHPGETQPIRPAFDGPPARARRFDDGTSVPLDRPTFGAPDRSRVMPPGDPAKILPLVEASPTESRLTKVARGFAIVRDFIIICFLVAAVILGGRVMSAIGDSGGRGVPAPPVFGSDPPCPHPSFDDYGTFCPGTPGG